MASGVYRKRFSYYRIRKGGVMKRLAPPRSPTGVRTTIFARTKITTTKSPA